MSPAGGPNRCPFCAIIYADEPVDDLVDRGAAVTFTPLNPVTPGHLLVVPRRHVLDAAQDPATTAATFAVAAELAGRGDCNLITSVGPAATQTVRHLHVHVVPRHRGDGLALPWSDRSA